MGDPIINKVSPITNQIDPNIYDLMKRFTEEKQSDKMKILLEDEDELENSYRYQGDSDYLEQPVDKINQKASYFSNSQHQMQVVQESEYEYLSSKANDNSEDGNRSKSRFSHLANNSLNKNGKYHF